MKKIERFASWESSNEAKHCNHQAVISQKKCMVKITDLDELEQQLELLKGKNKALQNVVDSYYTNSSISMINVLRENLSIVVRQRDEPVIVMDYGIERCPDCGADLEENGYE